MRHGRALVCITLAVATLVAGLAATAIANTAAGSWSPPTYLTDNVGGAPVAAAPVAAVNASGDIAAAWLAQSSAGTQINLASNFGQGFSVLDLGVADPSSAADEDHPQVAMDPSGDAIAVWLANGSVDYSAMLNPGESFGQPTTLDAATTDYDPHVAMDSGGDTIFTWAQQNTGTTTTWSVWYEICTYSNAAPQCQRAVEYDSGLSANPDPQVAVSRDGSAVIGFIAQRDGIDYGTLRGGFSNPAADPHFSDSFTGYADTSDTLSDLSVAIDASGNAMFAWLANNSGGETPYTAELPCGHTDGGAFPVSNTPSTKFLDDPTSGDLSGLTVAMDDTTAGDSTAALAVYEKSNAGIETFVLPSADYNDGNAWTATTDDSHLGGPYPSVATAPQLTVADVGTAATATLLFQSTGDHMAYASQAGTSPWPASATPITDIGSGEISSTYSLATDPYGNLVALWAQADSSANIQVIADCYQASAVSGLNASSCTGPAFPAPPSSGGSTGGTSDGGSAGGSPSGGGSAASTPAPVLRHTTDISSTTGTVRYRLPGSSQFKTLTAPHSIPFGTVIDARHGRVTITVALPNGKTSTAQFWDGEFILHQSASGAITASLAGGSFVGCPRPSRGRSHHDIAHVAKAKKKRKKKGSVVRSLWSKATGNYTTKGSYGAAAVLGTQWLTRDQCDGTYFKVTHTSKDPHGKIRVTVYHPHRHKVLLKQGHSILAPAPGYQR